MIFPGISHHFTICIFQLIVFNIFILFVQVYDESSQPSVPITRSQLHISVSTDNNEAPQLAPGSPTAPRVAADMDQMTVLHNGYLRYTDPDTSDRDIIYNITKY